MSRTDPAVAAAFVGACLAELDALKPGNVHRVAPGHRMSAADFVRSADASAAPIAAKGAKVGTRVRDAVRATLAAVGQNTNLGIVLLCAPLAAAAETRDVGLRPALAGVLDRLDREDAADVFAAIAAANPGGLGAAARHDVHAPAKGTLREAMAEAADRDRIARQYVTAYEDVFSLGLPALDAARRIGRDRRWSTLAVYLAFLAALPDTHILRKFDPATAEATRREAVRWRDALAASRPAQSVDRWSSAMGRRAQGARDQSRNKRGFDRGDAFRRHITVKSTRAPCSHALTMLDLGAGEITPPIWPTDPAPRRDADNKDSQFASSQRAGGFVDCLQPWEENCMAKINKMMVGESLVGDGNEVAHIDLIIGPRGSAAEIAFATALTNNKDGFTSLLAVVAPNLPAKPSTVMFNKVTIKGAKQAVQMFGPAQHAVAKAVADCVADGTIPAAEADDIFICVGVFIHWEAADDKKIHEFNYRAVKELIERAVAGHPTPAEVVAKRDTAKHPFSPA